MFYCICTYVFIFIFINSYSAQDGVTIEEGRITNIEDPINEQDVATKKYVDDAIDMLNKIPSILQSEGSSETATMSQ